MHVLAHLGRIPGQHDVEQIRDVRNQPPRHGNVAGDLASHTHTHTQSGVRKRPFSNSHWLPVATVAVVQTPQQPWDSVLPDPSPETIPPTPEP
eukprot:67571-Amphidinium_carterae.2